MSSEKKNNDYLLEVEHLKQYFPVHQGFSTIPLKAVDDISFAIRPGETLGLVGESGCGCAILVAIVGWAGYTGYNYYEDNKPAQTYYTNTSALFSYVSGLNTEAQ